MRVIKLMADYQCFPLWEACLGQVGNIGPEDLPISHELKTELYDWAQIYDETINMDDPLSSGFQCDSDESEFKKIGNELR